MRLRSSKVALLVAVLTLPIGGMGCGDDEPTGTPGDPPGGYPAATTPGQLVSNLARAFNERNYEEYDRLLHEDFVFFSGEDVGEDVTWDRQRELTYISRLFSGQPGEGPDGKPVPPVQKIQFTSTEEAGVPWTEEVAAEFDGTTMKRYWVDMLLTFTNGTSQHVAGLEELYAAPVEVDAGDGSRSTVYQLRYWRDLGKTARESSKATATTSWGELRARL